MGQWTISIDILTGAVDISLAQSNQITIGLGTHLFVKVPQPGDS